MTSKFFNATHWGVLRCVGGWQNLCFHFAGGLELPFTSLHLRLSSLGYISLAQRLLLSLPLLISSAQPSASPAPVPVAQYEETSFFYLSKYARSSFHKDVDDRQKQRRAKYPQHKQQIEKHIFFKQIFNRFYLFCMNVENDRTQIYAEGMETWGKGKTNENQYGLKKLRKSNYTICI